MIRYLKNKDIDKKSWDLCIDNSINGLIYAKSWYLDIVSPGWEALIEGDYNCMMPLPAKKKFMLHYLIQPRFIQQLGIFSNTVQNSANIEAFIKAIPHKFIWRDFNFNIYNDCNQIKHFSQRINYELNLFTSYTDIIKNYNENTRRNLVKAKQQGIIIEDNLLPNQFLQPYVIHSKIKQEGIALEQLKQLLEYSLRHNFGKVILAYDSTDQLIAGAYFLTGLNRIIYLTSFTSNKGKELSAMFKIMDKMIVEYCGQQFIFDLEGSMIPGIARFFDGFGATKTTYSRYRYSIIGFRD